VDRKLAAGAYQALGPARFPLILGGDPAGIVEAAGEANFAPGEEVFGLAASILINHLTGSVAGLDGPLAGGPARRKRYAVA
jgi:NADPH:quinone reductase-like Zn-dependent oxidoreductase